MAQAFGPENARLTVRTGRSGAAARAGHDLLIEVTQWSGTLDPDADPAVTLSVDPRSLRVIEGTGGMQALDDEDRTGIEQTIEDEVLKGTAIEFRSTRFDGLPGRVEGELELAGARRPVGFELAPREDGGVTGTAIVRQSDWGMKPYSALFGTLKVADEVEVQVETRQHAG
jgi:polyisoprenoid-binding protein YceI